VSARVIVVASTQREAAYAARELGYKPHSREVKLISRGVQVRGLRLTADDHVVLVRPETLPNERFGEIAANLRIAAFTCPADRRPVWDRWLG
jgi:hypothetical protein